MKVRKKRDRFNGMTEEEVLKKTLPDHLIPGLDIIIVSTRAISERVPISFHQSKPT